MNEYSYWEVFYMDLEGNRKHTVGRSPSNWEDVDVKEKFSIVDDIDYIIKVEETCEGDGYYIYDLID